MQAVSSQRALELQLRQFLRHDFNPALLTTLATHMQLLLLALGRGSPPPCGAPPQPAQATAAAGSAIGGASGRAADRVTPTNGGSDARGAGTAGGRWRQGLGPSSSPVGLRTGSLEGPEALGPEALLGLTLGEAARMRREEWGQLVAAAAESLAVSRQLAATTTAAAAAAAAAAGLASSSAAGAGACTCADLARLTRQVAAAHSALQHAAVAGWALGGFGPRRRFLVRLCEGIEARVERLEGLLMAMPDREAALQVCARGRQGASSLDVHGVGREQAA